MAVTIQTIADHLGVSKATVSFALRGSKRVSAATRKKVVATAKKLKYHANVNATALALRKSGSGLMSGENLACIVGHDDLDENPLKLFPAYRQVFTGAKARAEALGFSVESFWCHDPAMSQKRLAGILHARSIQGLLLLAMRRSEIKFNLEDFSCVYAGFAPSDHPDLNGCTQDHYQIGHLAMTKLIEKGYARIGLCIPNIYDAQEAYSAAHYAAQTHLAKPNRIPPLLTNKTPQSQAGFYKWVERNKPDAILTTGPTVPFWLQQARRDDWKKIALATLDRSESRSRGHNVMGIEKPWYTSGMVSMDLLVNQLRAGEHNRYTMPVTIRLPGIWKEADESDGYAI